MYLSLFLFYLVVFAFSLHDVFTLRMPYKKRVYFFLSCGVAVFTFLILDQIGNYDFVNYVENYNSLSSVGNFINGTNRGVKGFEVGYNFINCLFKIFISDGIFAVKLFLVLCIVGIAFQLYSYTQFWFIALLVYIGHFWGWNGLILIRQTWALIVLFPLLKWIPEKKYFHSILLILLATLFHASSLIYLLVIPLYKILQNNKILITTITISFLLGYFNLIPRFALWVIDYMPRGEIFKPYLNDTMGANMFSYLEMLFVLGFALYFKQRLCCYNKYANIAIAYLGISVIIAGLLQHYGVSMRLVMCFNFFAYIVLFPTAIQLFKKNWENRLIYVGILGAYLMIYFVRFIYTNLQFNIE